MKRRKRIASATELLEEAVQWRLLALLLSRPNPERKDDVEALAKEVHDPALAATARGWCDNAREGPYLHLLGPGGLVPARAVAYRGFADPGWLLADIARYHEAFGFHARAEEPLDHIATLAEFVSYLVLKEAYARDCGHTEAAAVTRGATEQFVAEHLTPVAARLAERLDTCGATEWSAAAHLIAARVPAPLRSAELPAADGPTAQCGACAGARPQSG